MSGTEPAPASRVGLPSVATRFLALTLIVSLLAVSASSLWAVTSDTTCPMNQAACTNAPGVGACCCLEGVPASTAWPQGATATPEAAREDALGAPIFHAISVDATLPVRLEDMSVHRCRPHIRSRAVLRI